MTFVLQQSFWSPELNGVEGQFLGRHGVCFLGEEVLGRGELSPHRADHEIQGFMENAPGG